MGVISATTFWTLTASVEAAVVFIANFILIQSMLLPLSHSAQTFLHRFLLLHPCLVPFPRRTVMVIMTDQCTTMVLSEKAM